MPGSAAGSPSDAASTSVPGLSQEDIDKIVAGVTAKYEDRIKGFQRLLADRDTREQGLIHELEELKAASLSPEERVQLREQKLAQQVRELQAKLELADLASKYGDVMGDYQTLIAAQKAEDQLAYLRSLRGGGKPQGEEGEGEPDIPPVDPNNPQRRAPEGITLPDGQVMTDSLADRILGSFSRMKDAR